jgi:hypothetical protein
MTESKSRANQRKYPPGEYDPRAPRPHMRGPRPHRWVTGPDPVEHKKYRVWIQQKNQAQWREEGWTISFEQWKQIWDQSGQWDNRGRERSCYCMTRRDSTLPWSVDNVHIITREQHSKTQSQAANAGYRSPAQLKRRIRLGLPLERQKPGRRPKSE